MPDPAAPTVHFGGPDMPPRLLRNLLRARIDAVPSGGEIVWATYYFRDRDLAAALIAASGRGVSVTLHVEGAPRRASANAAVLEMLETHGLAGGLHVHRAAIPALHPHLHSKIYCFSHPGPVALVGSFNPSGDVPEDAEVIAEIGDQDRGHNLLVELADPLLVAGLCGHVKAMGRPFPRLRQNRPVAGRDATAWFFPRLDTGIIDRRIDAAREITGCISHLKKGALLERLCRAAGRGATVRLLVHDTQRRVPDSAIARLTSAGVEIRRFVDPEGLPLHAKFLLVDGTAWFGSFNYNPRSRWLNREILLASRHPAITVALADRFQAIAAAA